MARGLRPLVLGGYVGLSPRRCSARSSAGSPWMVGGILATVVASLLVVLRLLERAGTSAVAGFA